MRHNYIVRGLHRVVALLVILQLLLGFGYGLNIITGYPSVVMTLHKSLGITLLIVMVVMLVMRLISGKVAYSPPLSTVQHFLAKFVHIGLYVATFGMALSGAIASALYNSQWKFFFVIPMPQIFQRNPELAGQIFAWHYVFAYILLVLVVLHIVAAMFHKVVMRDNIWQRMFK